MKKILGLGHPKMGTGYTAHLLKANGLNILHEKNGSDGMISWLSCVNRDDYPWGEKPQELEYEKFVVARSPLKAMKSVIAENNNWISLSWRHQAIKDQLDFDIFDKDLVSQDAVGLAVASLCLWYEICLSHDHEFVYRVDVVADNKLLSNMFDKDIIKKRGVFKNSHPERYAGYTYKTSDLKNLSDDWKLRLAGLCGSLGYPKDEKTVLDMV